MESIFELISWASGHCMDCRSGLTHCEATNRIGEQALVNMEMLPDSVHRLQLSGFDLARRPLQDVPL
jgi:hypothetical protein